MFLPSLLPTSSISVARHFHASRSRLTSRNDESPPSDYSKETELMTEMNDYYKRKFQTSQGDLEFSHFDSQTSRPKQVDISEKKPASTRVASVSGYIQLNEVTFRALAEDKLKKGNALVVAQIAGIQASKQTSNLIPLCHQVLLDVCDVTFKTDAERFRIYCQAMCKSSLGKTGVEMEAFTACTISLVTIYDMCKAMQKDASIHDIKLDYKRGGKSDFGRS